MFEFETIESQVAGPCIAVLVVPLGILHDRPDAASSSYDPHMGPDPRATSRAVFDKRHSAPYIPHRHLRVHASPSPAPAHRRWEQAQRRALGRYSRDRGVTRRDDGRRVRRRHEDHPSLPYRRNRHPLNRAGRMVPREPREEGERGGSGTTAARECTECVLPDARDGLAEGFWMGRRIGG